MKSKNVSLPQIILVFFVVDTKSSSEKRYVERINSSVAYIG